MTQRTRETLFGTIAVAIGVLVLAVNVLQRHEAPAIDDGTMELVAVFNQVDGLNEGASVRMAGVPVGVVSGMTLTDDYKARTTLKVRRDVPLPDDTAAIIETEGLFGAKYVELQPGGSFDELTPGDRVAYTQDSVILEDLLAKIVARAKAQQPAAGAAPAAAGQPGGGADGGGAGNPFPSLTD